MHPMNQKNSIRQGLNLMKKKTYIYLLALVPFLIVAMLYEIVPLITVIVKSFQPDGGTGFTLENYQSVFSKLLYQKAIINSIKISLTSAVAGIIIAFLGARAAHQHQGKLNHVFMTVLNMVSNFAGIPLAFAYMILFGQCRTGGQYRQGIGHQCFIHIQSVHDERHEPDLYLFPDSAFYTSSDPGL